MVEKSLDPSEIRVWVITAGKQPRPTDVQAEGTKNLELVCTNSLEASYSRKGCSLEGCSSAY